MLICWLLPALLYIWAVREPPPPWRATHFDHDGPGKAVTIVREERDVNRHNHHWGDRDALRDISGDRASVLWDSCLSLGRAQSVAFQLTSHDPARLFIDGRPVLDNVGQRPLPRTRGTDALLEAGVHHLRVEYHERIKSASLTLVASFDGTRPRRIAPERLRFPDGDLQHPCKAVPAP
jgi:hypothetical protein